MTTVINTFQDFYAATGLSVTDLQAAEQGHAVTAKYVALEYERLRGVCSPAVAARLEEIYAQRFDSEVKNAE